MTLYEQQFQSRASLEQERPVQETAAILVAERITGNIANGKAWNRNCNTEQNLTRKDAQIKEWDIHEPKGG